MYEYTDKIIRYLNKRFIRIFGNAKDITSFDALNVIQYSHSMYAELEKITAETLLLLAKQIYKDNVKLARTDIAMAWLLGLLSQYDPITKYVYSNEVDRKCSRFAESVIASNTKVKEIETALRLWSAMTTQYAIEVTDAACKQAYVDDGVEKVIWMTMEDDRRCSECMKRGGKIYDIAKVPPKPHIGCRCYLLPYFGRED